MKLCIIMDSTKFPQTSVKTDHSVAILRLIHLQPGITKPELCNQTGLMPSTVHGAVAKLLDDQLIVRQGMAASNGDGAPANIDWLRISAV